MEKIIYSKSLKAKLTLERNFMMESYQTLMDVVNTRKDILVVSSFYKDRIAFGKNKIALIKAFRKNLVVYFHLNPNKINEKIGITDVSNTISYKNYPVKLIIEDSKDLKNAIKLMEKSLSIAKADEIVVAEDIDYNELLPERTFDELVELGLIKKRVKYIDDNESVDYVDNPSVVEEVKIPMVNVKFKVMVKGKMTDNLYLFTNYTNWDENQVIELNKVDDYFVLETKFPKNYDLEFKISLSKNWQGVEKGIFGEEIKNHKYILSSDMEIEDIIYNFRFN